MTFMFFGTIKTASTASPSPPSFITITSPSVPSPPLLPLTDSKGTHALTKQLPRNATKAATVLPPACGGPSVGGKQAPPWDNRSVGSRDQSTPLVLVPPEAGSAASSEGHLAATRQQSLQEGKWMAWSDGTPLLLLNKQTRVKERDDAQSAHACRCFAVCRTRVRVRQPCYTHSQAEVCTV